MVKKIKDVMIKTVSFRACITVAQYQTVHIEACADVPAGAEPRDVVDKLKVFVASELKRAKRGEREVVARQGTFRELLHD